MAKSGDILDQLLEQMADLNKKMANFSLHQVSMVENYEILMQNQTKVADNHDIVVKNQNTIIKNQGIITQNQSSIIHNQAVIVKNQAYLKTFLYAQTEILTLLTNKPKEIISKEITDFFESAQLEISKGFEKPVGE